MLYLMRIYLFLYYPTYPKLILVSELYPIHHIQLFFRSTPTASGLFHKSPYVAFRQIWNMVILIKPFLFPSQSKIKIAAAVPKQISGDQREQDMLHPHKNIADSKLRQIKRALTRRSGNKLRTRF